MHQCLLVLREKAGNCFHDGTGQGVRVHCELDLAHVAHGLDMPVLDSTHWPCQGHSYCGWQ